MRRFDKNKNIQNTNILAEQRYLQTKGLVNENIGKTSLNEMGGPVPIADIKIEYVGAPDNIDDEKINRCMVEAKEAVRAVLKDVFGVPVNIVKVSFNGESQGY
jgi:hypothetical protein